ncbi:MAG: hypothetical protein MUE42_03320 [Opitutaceae bacterium]|nr:hypothetical protein [Opitutaceae bacterium]
MTAPAAPALSLDLATAPRGRVFEGIGALSAGASSQLLVDYPEPARSRILDLLFAPGIGAAIHHFKIEIGGDVNSTCGTEPSHRRDREETPDFTRGYEWWLMREARARNPGIILDAVPWGAPGWIGDGRYYSQDMADYVCDFLEGAAKTHGLDIAYVGIWNERAYDIPWIKLLRRTLDSRGLSRVRIVGADANTKQWAIAEDILRDPELAAAVDVIGDHYLEFSSTPAARATGKRLWAAEDGPWRGDWTGAMRLAKLYNRNYATGRMTKTIIWSLVTSYYDNLPLPGSGLLRANTPWSGAFSIEPALWATAHTTRFTTPGWHYLDGDGSRLLPGGSIVALVSPDGQNLTLVLESMDAEAPLALSIRLPVSFTRRGFRVVLTTETSSFQFLPALAPDAAGMLELIVPPRAILTLTTLASEPAPLPPSPPATAFPTPYRDDFSHTPPGRPGRYCSDQGGVFEVVATTDAGPVLRQQITRAGIDWQPTPEPSTFLGEPSWQDQSIRVRARFPVPAAGAPAPAGPCYLAVYLRAGYFGQNAHPAPAYAFRLYADGRWELRDARRVLAYGLAPAPGHAWHVLELGACSEHLSARLDGVPLAALTDQARAYGLAGLGCGLHHAEFADLHLLGYTPEDLARRASATASSQFDAAHGPERAIDGVAADGLAGPTRWRSGAEPLPQEWIALAFPEPCRLDTVRIVPDGELICAWRIDARIEDDWRTLAYGNATGAYPITARFSRVTTDRLRLVFEHVYRPVSLIDLQVHYHGYPSTRAPDTRCFEPASAAGR